MTGRNWLFVLTDPEGPIDWDSLGTECIRYAVYIHKYSDQLGCFIYKGYVEFTQTVRKGYCLKILPEAHWYARSAHPVCLTRSLAQQFIREDPNIISGPYEYGEWVTQGQHKMHTIIYE